MSELSEVPWDDSLVAQALIHPSYAFEASLPVDNQRLEFLGDAVLGLALGEALFLGHEDFDEGELTRLRSRLARRQTLARVGRDIGIEHRIRLGKGERTSGGPLPEKVVADAFEAVLGALFLIWGYEHTRKFILDVLQEVWEEEIRQGGWTDAKSLLQERLQTEGVTPSYEMEEDSGPPHMKSFRVAVRAGRSGPILGEGSGRSKKAAETQAAERALEKLGTRDEAASSADRGQRGD